VIKQPEYKSALISLGGIKKLLEYIVQGANSNTASLIVCYAMDTLGVAEKDVWEFGVDKFEKMAY
jgi:hypothetical protein